MAGGATAFPLSVPLRVNNFNLLPQWAGVAPETYGTVTFFGPETPRAPTLGAGLHAGPAALHGQLPGHPWRGHAVQEPVDDTVGVLGDDVSAPDYYDGLRVVGPAGGTNERSGVFLADSPHCETCSA